MSYEERLADEIRDVIVYSADDSAISQTNQIMEIIKGKKKKMHDPHQLQCALIAFFAMQILMPIIVFASFFATSVIQLGWGWWRF